MIVFLRILLPPYFDHALHVLDAPGQDTRDKGQKMWVMWTLASEDVSGRGHER